MQKHLLWAALISSGVIASALSFSACGEVESCKPGAAGCVGGAPEGGKCKFDLVAKNGKCVEPGSAGGNNGGSNDDAGANGADSGPMSACAPCDDPALCVPSRKECVNFCEMPDEYPGAGPYVDQIFCGGELDADKKPVELNFAETCKNTCLLTCRWQKDFCDGYDCADYCDQPDRITECMDAVTGCGGAADAAAQLSCQYDKCAAIRALGCVADADLCPNAVTPQCGDVVCSNDCDSRNLFDGYCDDGAFNNSATDLCAWGTDCADCGPRLGAPRPMDDGDIAIGDLCPNSYRCEGNTFAESRTILSNGSFCRPIGLAADGLYRCVQDCSSEGEECPAGFECTKLDYKDIDERPGRACFPIKACP